MKTRADIYGQEAAELLRLVSLYPGLSQSQLAGFFPEKDCTVIGGLLSHLNRQGRIQESDNGGWFPYGSKPQSDIGLCLSVWVLLDMMEKVEYHSPGDFPVKIVFFSDGELYEIVYVAVGQEALVSHAMKLEMRQEGRRIVLVEAAEQISLLDFPHISGFCTASRTGEISYYKKQ